MFKIISEINYEDLLANISKTLKSTLNMSQQSQLTLLETNQSMISLTQDVQQLSNANGILQGSYDRFDKNCKTNTQHAFCE